MKHFAKSKNLFFANTVSINLRLNPIKFWKFKAPSAHKVSYERNAKQMSTLINWIKDLLVMARILQLDIFCHIYLNSASSAIKLVHFETYFYVEHFFIEKFLLTVEFCRKILVQRLLSETLKRLWRYLIRRKSSQWPLNLHSLTILLVFLLGKCRRRIYIFMNITSQHGC
jgi:hypothetical protein